MASPKKSTPKKEDTIQISFSVTDYAVPINNARKLIHLFVESMYPLFGELCDAKGKKITLSAERSKELVAEFEAWSEIIEFLRDRGIIRSRIKPALAEAFLGTLMTGALLTPEDWEPIHLDFTAKDFDTFIWATEDGDMDSLAVFLRSEDHRTHLLTLLKRIREECFADVTAKCKARKERAKAEEQQAQARQDQQRAKELERRRNESIKALRAMGYTVTPPGKAPNLPEIIEEFSVARSIAPKSPNAAKSRPRINTTALKRR